MIYTNTAGKTVKITQTELNIVALLENGPLTTEEGVKLVASDKCLQVFIFNLRKKGFDIRTERVKNAHNRGRKGIYHLAGSVGSDAYLV